MGASRGMRFSAMVPCLAVFVLLFSLGPVACLTPMGSRSPENTVRITIVTTGILQGTMGAFERHYSRGRVRRFGDPARVATVIDREIARARTSGSVPLVVDLGDNLSGSAEALLTEGRVMARVLGAFPLRAALLGNLEFGFGWKRLAEYRQSFGIPFVSTNLVTRQGEEPAFASSYVEIPAGKVKVLVAGISPPNLKYLCRPSNVEGIKVRSDLRSVFVEAGREKLRRKASVLIVLSQLPLGMGLEQLKKDIDGTGVDILFGLDYDREGSVRSLGSTRLLSFNGRNRGQRVQVSDISVVPGKGLLGISTRFELVDTERIPRKAAVARILDDARKKYAARLDRVIAVADVSLKRSFFTDGDIGNLLTDAMKEYSSADVALMNSGGVAHGLNAGPVRLRDLYRVLPYQNHLLHFQVQGAVLKKYLCSVFQQGGMFQVSGAGLCLSKAGDGPGYKLDKLTINGEPVKPGKLYILAINDFLFGRSPDLKAAGPVREGPLLRSILESYIKKAGRLERPAGGRIEFVNPQARR